jgi:hypothetical protein
MIIAQDGDAIVDIIAAAKNYAQLKSSLEWHLKYLPIIAVGEFNPVPWLNSIGLVAEGKIAERLMSEGWSFQAVDKGMQQGIVDFTNKRVAIIRKPERASTAWYVARSIYALEAVDQLQKHQQAVDAWVLRALIGNFNPNALRDIIAQVQADAEVDVEPLTGMVNMAAIPERRDRERILQESARHQLVAPLTAITHFYLRTMAETKSALAAYRRLRASQPQFEDLVMEEYLRWETEGKDAIEKRILQKTQIAQFPDANLMTLTLLSTRLSDFDPNSELPPLDDSEPEPSFPAN